MNSKEAMLLSKLGKKKVPSSELAYDEKELKSMNELGAEAGAIETDSTGGSLDFIKAAKAGSKFDSTTMNPSFFGGTMPNKVEETPVPKTKKVPYSPIKTYLKKGY